MSRSRVIAAKCFDSSPHSGNVNVAAGRRPALRGQCSDTPIPYFDLGSKVDSNETKRFTWRFAAASEGGSAVKVSIAKFLWNLELGIWNFDLLLVKIEPCQPNTYKPTSQFTDRIIGRIPIF